MGAKASWGERYLAYTFTLWSISEEVMTEFKHNRNLEDGAGTKAMEESYLLVWFL